MQSNAVMKEHEMKRRDLLILKYDKQRSLCDEIIQRQRALIEGKTVLAIDPILHCRYRPKYPCSFIHRLF